MAKKAEQATKPDDEEFDANAIVTPEEEEANQPIEVDLSADDAGNEIDAAGKDDAGSGDDPSQDDEIRKQLEAAQKRAEAAERERDEIRRAADEDKRKAAAEQSDSRLQTISSAMDATDAKIKDAKARVRAAREAGDIDAEEAAADELYDLKIRHSRLNEGKMALEQRIEQEKEAPRQPSRDDEMAKWKATLSHDARRWVDDHPDAVSTPQKAQRLGLAHQAAIEFEGLTQDSPEYFEYINKRMGYADDPAPQQRQQRAAASAPAAPVSRSSVSTQTGRQTNKMTLTPAEREAADLSGISYADYAKNKLAAIKAGEISTRH